MTDYLPLGSLSVALYVAADSRARATDLVTAVPDMLIADMEEALTEDRYEIGRANLSNLMLSARHLAIPLFAVRVNGYGTQAFDADMAAVESLPQDVAIVVPKPVTMESLASIPPHRAVFCMGEEASFAAQFEDLSRVFSNICGVIIGAKDLSNSLGIEFDAQSALLREAVNDIRSVAQFRGVPVIDGVAFGTPQAVNEAVHRSISDRFDGVSVMRWSDVIQTKTMTSSRQL